MKCIKFAIVLIISMIVPFSAFSQQAGITPDVLKKIQESYKSSPENKALQNAIVNNDINKIAVNHDNAGAFDTYFSHRVPSQAVTDQKSSGRCWMFTGMNVLRAK
ncbi:MAG: aminopeptidase, partial [Bacteroidales bacterium]|nr:aminopeptidase [Bacteroidales bacterium]